MGSIGMPTDERRAMIIGKLAGKVYEQGNINNLNAQSEPKHLTLVARGISFEVLCQLKVPKCQCLPVLFQQIGSIFVVNSTSKRLKKLERGISITFVHRS